MRVHKFLVVMGAAALMQPPIAVEAQVLTIPSCGGGAHRMLVPGNPADPDQRRDCGKACHAVTDRRSKSGALKKDCC